MAKYIFILLIAYSPRIVLSQINLVDRDVLQRVFEIKYGTGVGTCFLLSVDSIDYLITSRHIFGGSPIHKSKVEFELLKEKKWIKFPATLMLNVNSNIDIAVLSLGTNEAKGNGFDIGGLGYYLSQDCYFLGFPYGLHPNNDINPNAGFPLPMIKKGIISSWTHENPDGLIIFLDGNNNPGFSGGPVVIFNPVGQTHHSRIIAVVTAYVNDPEKTIKTPIGDFLTNENTGIVISYHISHAIDIINRK